MTPGHCLRPGLVRRVLPAFTLVLLISLAAALASAPPAFRGTFLANLASPDLDLILLLSGILLLYAEANLPGAILPGTLGALVTMLACFGLSRLTLRPTAVILLALGLTLLLLDFVLPARKLLPALGAVSLITGLASLTPAVNPAVAIATGIIFATVTLWLGRIAIRARRNKQISTQPAHARFTTSIPAATSRQRRSVD